MNKLEYLSAKKHADPAAVQEFCNISRSTLLQKFIAASKSNRNAASEVVQPLQRAAGRDPLLQTSEDEDDHLGMADL